VLFLPVSGTDRAETSFLLLFVLIRSILFALQLIAKVGLHSSYKIANLTTYKIIIGSFHIVFKRMEDVPLIVEMRSIL
jgi:hypothetical protein